MIYTKEQVISFVFCSTLRGVPAPLNNPTSKRRGVSSPATRSSDRVRFTQFAFSTLLYLSLIEFRSSHTHRSIWLLPASKVKYFKNFLYFIKTFENILSLTGRPLTQSSTTCFARWCGKNSRNSKR